MKKLALLGNPVEHSKSPAIYNTIFNELAIESNYTSVNVDNKKLLLSEIKKYDSVNITYPYKNDAYNLCDKLDPSAELSKSVNTIINHKGELVGYNTDGLGLLDVIKSYKKINSILIIGAGNTARTAILTLQYERYDLTVVNRSKKNITPLKKKGIRTFLPNDLPIKRYDLIINMTSAGLDNNDLPLNKDILDKLIPLSKGGIDVNYNKKTSFLALYKENGISCQDGVNMLLNQAVYAFNIFTENEYSFKEVKKILLKNLLL